MKLIVGLGNPGPKYDNTPHNIGFRVVDTFCGDWKYRDNTLFGEVAIGDAKVYLMKPLTFMNLSGEAVKLFSKYHNIAPEEILVISDDINIPVGTIRLRQEGSHGGHNGLRNIIDHLGTNKFPRLRVGFKPEEAPDNLIDYVLGKIKPDIKQKVDDSVERSASAILYIQEKGFENAMTAFNGGPKSE